VDPDILRAGLAHVATGAAEAGRGLADLDVALWAPPPVALDGELARAPPRGAGGPPPAPSAAGPLQRRGPAGGRAPAARVRCLAARHRRLPTSRAGAGSSGPA